MTEKELKEYIMLNFNMFKMTGKTIWATNFISALDDLKKIKAKETERTL